MGHIHDEFRRRCLQWRDFHSAWKQRTCYCCNESRPPVSEIPARASCTAVATFIGSFIFQSICDLLKNEERLRAEQVHCQLAGRRMLSWPTTLPISQFFLVRRLAAQVKWHCGWSTVIKHSGTGRCRKFLRDIRQRTAHAAGPRGLPPNAAISHDVDDCDDSNNQTFGNCRIPGRNSSYRPSVSPFWYAVFIDEGAFFFF